MFTALTSKITALFSGPELMPQADIDVIREFARGNESLREEAIRAHRRNVLTVGVRGNVFQRFMAEIDTPVPDINHRDDLRRLVVGWKR